MRINKSTSELDDSLYDAILQLPIFRRLIMQTINVAAYYCFVTVVFNPTHYIGVFVSV